MNFTFLIVKILNLVPVSLWRKIGYSKIGSIVLKFARQRFVSKKYFDIGNGIRIHLDYSSPRNWNLILGEDKEKKVKQIFLDNINEGDTVIDCGANVGEFSLIAAKKTGHAGKVISIEPVRKYATQLKENFLLNNISNFEVIEAAISNETGKKTLYEYGISELSNLDPSLLHHPLTGTSEVSLETLDNIISTRDVKKVGMIKMDIDGFEYEAFLGCQKSFDRNKIRNIICEVHYSLLPKKNLNEDIVYDLLIKNGFSVVCIDKDSTGQVTYILAKNIRE